MTPATFALIGKVLAGVALALLIGKGVTSCQDHYRDQGRAEVQAQWDKAAQAQATADAQANQQHRTTEGKDRANVSTAQSQRAQTAGTDAALAAGLRTERDGLRRDLATDWLTKTTRPLGRIGADLGFADAAAFYRAFAGWTGSGPREYRKRFRHSTTVPPHPP